MATSSSVSTSAKSILKSEWTGLNENLIAKFYAVDSNGSRVGQDQTEVWAPLIDSNLEAVFGWQSPFEHSNPDTKAPALTAMLQSGVLLPVLNALSGGSKSSNGPTSSSDKGALQSALQSAQGRTGITKLNSTQIFSGMPPLKFTVSLLFRAIFDPATEVEAPLQQLWGWALPQKLSNDGIVARVISQKNGIADYVSALLPSLAPTMIGFQYKRCTYGPLVIESIGEPLSSPIDKNGFYTELVIPMTLCSLTALDRDDMHRIRTRS
ncbi:hypothetical protein ACXX82_19570 [Glaciimonas sp. GNP009]